jgi:hypothetical protein
MAHIKSSSFQDGDGIFLWQTEDDKRVRRIGGPYFSNEAADKASKAVSEAMGERPVEDYIKYLRQDYPGVVGGQSPIPKSRREPTNEEFEVIFNERAREYREGLRKELIDPDDWVPPEEPKPGIFGRALDWLVNPAGAQEMSYRGSTYDPALGSDSPPNYQALGIIPQEPTSLFNTGFVTDIKHDPKSFRVPIDPNPYRWGADMSGVKFGTALPDRNAVEDMILEASGIAGVAPEYTEGLRTEAQNTKLGAHEKSKHLTGQAFDLAISRNKEKDKRYERELIRLFVPLGFSVILKSDHIHLQTPPPDVDLLPNSSWSN